MLESKELVRFAEGVADIRAETEEAILKQVASSPDIRRQLAEIRRDLYLVECQIPEYRLTPEYLLEINKLAEAWLKMRLERRLKLHKFLFGREFLSIALLLAAILVLSLVIISIY